MGRNPSEQPSGNASQDPSQRPSQPPAGRKTRQPLTAGPVGVHLIKLTLPMVWGIFAMIGFNLVDTYYLGHLGTVPLAAISFTFPVVATLASLGMGLGVGASSIIARAIGQRQRDRVQCLTTCALALTVLLAAVFSTVGLLTLDPLFTAMGATPAVLPLIREYMEIWYPGLVFVALPTVGNFILRSAGNTVFPSLVLTVAAGINVVLDPLLIFGLAGFPALGMQGAALATVVARASSLVACVAMLGLRERMLLPRLPPLRDTLQAWGQILYVGLPAGAANTINPISVGLLTSLMATFGTEAVAAFGIAARLKSFSTIPLVALATSIAPFVGQNWGAQHYARVRRALGLGARFAVGWGLLLAAVLALLAPWIAGQFTTDETVIAIAVRYLRIVPISYGALGIILVANYSTNALGRPLPGAVLLLLRTVVLHLPLAYLGGWLFGVTGIFAAAVVSDGLLGVGAYLWNTYGLCPPSLGEGAAPESATPSAVGVGPRP